MRIRPLVPAAQEAPRTAVRTCARAPAEFAVEIVAGTGGKLLVEQLRRSGVRFLFANPSSHTGLVFDAMLERSDMQVILGLQESALAAMADGFAKAGGGIPFVLVARPGLPNTLACMYNAFRDRSPMVVATDQLNEMHRGQFGIQEVDDLLATTEPFTRWRWECRRADKIADDLRRAFKFAGTPPSGPVFLSIPQDFLAERNVRAEVIDQRYFELSTGIRPAAQEVDETARLLVEADSPLLYVGPEVYRHGAEAAVVELAELLGLPVTQESFGWSNAFPTDHPLYLGYHQPRMRHPTTIDLFLDLGGRLPQLPDGAALVHVGLDVDSLGRVHPAVLTSAANIRLFVEDLMAALRARLTSSRITKLAAERRERTASFTAGMRMAREQAARGRWNDAPIAHERLAMELAVALDPRTCVVQIADSGQIILNYLSFGRDRMSCFTSNGQSLGWSLGAALGTKLARPEQPVVALMGDGDFLFGGSQALWTAQRYEIPIIVVVLDNRSYDNERNRIWSRDSRQAELGKDMTCYIGNPDVEYRRLAAAYGVAAEKATTPHELGAALRRAVAANREGRSYLLDVMIARRGRGADSTWYPAYSLARERRRGV